MAESRTRKSILNARINLIFYFITIVVSFFSRKIFLDCLGADFVGLACTLENILGFLNLAELGVGSAIAYVLYQPLFEQNHLKINEVISVMGYLYRLIGFIILFSGIILSLFLPCIFPSTEIDFPLTLIYFAFYSFLCSSLIGYFINYRQNLLSADQKNYVVAAYFQTATIIKTLLQMASASYTKSYYLWVLIELIFGFVYCIILDWKIKKTYPWLNADVKLGKKVFYKYPEVIKYTKQIFIHKITFLVQYKTEPILIYSFVSLGTVALYGNYTLLAQKVNALLQNVLDSTSAGIGNLIAEGNKQKIYRVYWELMAFRFWFVTIICYVLYESLPSFIILWLGKQYLLSQNVLILLLTNNVFIAIIRGTTDQFIFGKGMFNDVGFSILQAILFISFALIGGYFWKLEGILLASTLSLFVVIMVWKPYFLFVKGFHKNVLLYWANFALYLIMSICCSVLAHYLFEVLFTRYYPLHACWLNLIMGITIASIIILILYTSFILVFTSGARNFCLRIFQYIDQ